LLGFILHLRNLLYSLFNGLNPTARRHSAPGCQAAQRILHGPVGSDLQGRELLPSCVRRENFLPARLIFNHSNSSSLRVRSNGGPIAGLQPGQAAHGYVQLEGVPRRDGALDTTIAATLLTCTRKVTCSSLLSHVGPYAASGSLPHIFCQSRKSSSLLSLRYPKQNSLCDANATPPKPNAS
jgi:hypothetical protein